MAQNGNPHSIYQPLAAVSQPGPIYVSNMATLRRQSAQAVNPAIGAHHHQLQQQLQQQQQQQQHPQQQQPPQPLQIKSPQGTIEVPSSNSIDSAMYERDKQIYKCSTLRQGGKFDPKYKPSILNCPLPEIPKDDSPKHETSQQQQQQQQLQQQQQKNYSKTLQRPPMKLPAHMKAIPPPRIEATTSSPQTMATSTTSQNHIAGQLQTTNSVSTTDGAAQNQCTTEDTSLPPPPTSLQSIVGGSQPNVANAIHMHVGKNNNNNNNNNNNSVNSGLASMALDNNMADDDDLPPPPPPAITDESNYAVTEL